MTAADRDKKGIIYLRNVLSSTRLKTDKDFESLKDYQTANNLLKILIPVKVDGFRGVVMTAIVGMHIDDHKSFNPLTNFYGCNPRSIYEKGIYCILEEFKIPSAKSAPLNVAKTVSQLDDTWIQGRKTSVQPIARAAVEFLALLVSTSKTPEYDKLVEFFFYRLLQYAKSVESTKIYELNPSHLSKNEISFKLLSFTLQYPEAGTIPQTVIGKLLRFVNQSDIHNVRGEGESVFGTNTTSKKPADIWIENKECKAVNLYEITVKKIDKKRLDDCVDSLAKLSNIESKEIVFLCRMTEDTKELGLDGSKNSIYHKGYWFNFIDIKWFIYTSLSMMNSDQIKDYFTEMQLFINEINRPLGTKNGWNKIFCE